MIATDTILAICVARRHALGLRRSFPSCAGSCCRSWSPECRSTPTRVPDPRPVAPDPAAVRAGPNPAEPRNKPGCNRGEPPTTPAARTGQQRPWTMADWLYWFDAASYVERSWRWWDSAMVDHDHLWIDVDVLEDPAPRDTRMPARRWCDRSQPRLRSDLDAETVILASRTSAPRPHPSRHATTPKTRKSRPHNRRTNSAIQVGHLGELAKNLPFVSTTLLRCAVGIKAPSVAI